jgi:capsular polysaccharide biosynthesis protein
VTSVSEPGYEPSAGPRRGVGWIWPRLRGRWLLLVIVLVAVTGCVVLAGVVRPGSTVATAAVLINPLDGNPYSTGARGQNLTNLQTEAELVSSDAVVDSARKTLGSSDDNATVAGRVTVDIPSNTQVLQISYAARTNDKAIAGANAFAHAYLAVRAQRAAVNATAQLQLYTAEATKVQASQTSIAGQLTKTSASSPRGQVLTQQLTVYSAQLAKLQSTISDLRTSQPDPGEILTPAATASTGLGLPIYVLAGLVLGLLAAAALAGWMAFADNRVYETADLERAGFAALGDPVTDDADLSLLLNNPAAAITDPDRSRRIMVAVGVPAVPATLLIVGETALAAALRLSVALVRADSSVILIDTARGALTEAVEELPGPGLSEVLLRRREALKVLRRPQPRLSFLASGAEPEEAADRLLSERWNGQLSVLNQHAEYVVLCHRDAASADSLALANSATAVILCATAGTTRLRDLRTAADELARCGGEVLGVFLSTQSDPSPTEQRATGAQSGPDSPVPTADNLPEPATAERS